jgi:nucleoside-diphosphate-sugar epimerase
MAVVASRELLVLGGTAWLGGHIVAAAQADGWAVTCLARGAAVPAGARLVTGDRDDPAALAGVASRRWEVVIDLCREPGHARGAAAALSAATERAIYVSSASAYRDHDTAGATEDSPLLAPLAADRMTSPGQYGAAKAACELAWTAALGAQRLAVVRPGLIGGPGDISDRTGYWPLRMAAQPGPVLVPRGTGQSAQVIDVRDLAAWIVALARDAVVGSFNAVGTAMPLRAHLADAAMVAGYAGPYVCADDDWLSSHGVQPWAGPDSLPLWLPDPSYRGFAARSNARALSHDLRLRPLSVTLGDTLAWELGRQQPPVRAAGLSPGREQQLLLALGETGMRAAPPGR